MKSFLLISRPIQKSVLTYFAVRIEILQQGVEANPVFRSKRGGGPAISNGMSVVIILGKDVPFFVRQGDDCAGKEQGKGLPILACVHLMKKNE